jgi:hypothetical protein
MTLLHPRQQIPDPAFERAVITLTHDDVQVTVAAINERLPQR